MRRRLGGIGKLEAAWESRFAGDRRREGPLRLGQEHLFGIWASLGHAAVAFGSLAALEVGQRRSVWL